MRMVVIEHDDGRRFAVDPKDFYGKPVTADGKTYERAGFRIVRWEDGTEYVREERIAIKSEVVAKTAAADERADRAARPADRKDR